MEYTLYFIEDDHALVFHDRGDFMDWFGQNSADVSHATERDGRSLTFHDHDSLDVLHDIHLDAKRDEAAAERANRLAHEAAR